MTGNAVTWPKETAYTDGSGITAESTAAGETTFTITSQTNLPAVIDSYVEMSNLMLEDFPALVSYLNTQLPANLLETEDNEILNGTGNIKGLIANCTAFSAASATVTAPQYYDVITMAAKQISLCEMWPTAIIMNPTDVALMKLSKDQNNQYVFPFIFMQGSRVVVNGVPVIENTAMTAGTYLIGDFARGCQLWVRRGLTLKFYDSAAAGDVNKHQTTVVIDERVALSMFRTLAFVTDTFAASITELTP
jgi:HK97 family phage major capsid protein